MRKPIDRRSTKTKILEAVVFLALLGIAAFFAKGKYDEWHAQQPFPVALAALQEVSQDFPEAGFTENSLDVDKGFPRPEGYVYEILDEEGAVLGEIELTVTGKDMFRKPLYAFSKAQGKVTAEVVGSDESIFTVDDRGYGHTWTEPEDPLFPGKVSTAGVGGLFTDLQIVPGEGYTLTKAQEERIYLTVEGDEDDAEEIRAAASEYLARYWDTEENEFVSALTLTEPVFLSEDEAVVFARCSHGLTDEDQTETESALYVRYNKRTRWTVRAEEKAQVSILPYTDEDVFEIPAYVEPPKSAVHSQPYYIMVNRQMNTVTIYEKDSEGYYTVPVKAMICSTGREGHETPLGDYEVQSFKAEWCYMIDGSYGQYATGFRDGGYLFHSVCYTAKDRATLMADEYNALGDFASAGCVRLQVADAKWIFENCAVGTGVTVYDGPNAGPLGKPEKAVEEITDANNNGWDPTDPDPNNPWNSGN